MEENRLNPKDECLTVSVPTFGKLCGISRGAAYAAAARGDIPGLIRIGKPLMVSKIAAQRALENGWQPPLDSR
jgi:hypothetical protein